MTTTHSDFVVSMMTAFFLAFVFALGLWFGRLKEVEMALINLTLILSFIGTVLTYYSPQIMYMLKEGH